MNPDLPDYEKAPKVWGSAEVAAWFPEFKHVNTTTSGAIIRSRHGGSRPPLLLDSNPQGHVSWSCLANPLGSTQSLLTMFRLACSAAGACRGGRTTKTPMMWRAR